MPGMQISGTTCMPGKTGMLGIHGMTGMLGMQGMDGNESNPLRISRVRESKINP